MDRVAAMNVLVFGASGYVGSHLVPALSDTRARVRAVSRNQRVLEAREWAGVELAQADALDPSTLPAVLDGIEVAFYLVHSMGSGAGFDRRDVAAATHFAAAAEQAGVGRIIYLGGIIPPDSHSPHLRSRAATGDALRASTVPVVELRAGIIVGPGSAAFEVMRDLVNHLPLMITPRWVRSHSSPIALTNVLYYLVQLALVEVPEQGIYEVAGPEELSYQEMMLAYARKAGKRIRIVPVPLLTPSLSSWWLKLVTSVPKPIAAALIEGLEHDFVASDQTICERFPQHLLNFDESLDVVASAEQSNQIAARWVEGAFPLRDYNPDYSYYAKQAGAETVTSASAASCWRIIEGIGGKRGYFYLDPLWRLRELLDWCVGGYGMQRKRRDPDDLRVGDRIDSWRVIGMRRNERLTLKFGMKAPGAGVLEFELHECDAGCQLSVRAYWHPAGVWGLLYWFALVPAHLVIFKGMAAEIARRAETLEEEKKKDLLGAPSRMQ
jgi:uncharacterized protein YbjT (DUF2867 family)